MKHFSVESAEEDLHLQGYDFYSPGSINKITNLLVSKNLKVNIGPMPFDEVKDPLGSSVVPTITYEQRTRSQYQMLHLGNQASQLLLPQDRIVALTNLISSIHILLSRSITLKVLSLLTSSSNTVNLVKNLETMGLSDMHKIVSLMTLTAINRVEVSGIQTPTDYYDLPFTLNKNLQQLISHVSLPNSYCLHHLSTAIAALAENDIESSKLLVEMCSKDLIVSAAGVLVSSKGFSVTQALINILSAHGGSSLMQINTENVPLSPTAESAVHLNLINALSAYILSSSVHHKNRQWASQQLFRCVSTRTQMLIPPDPEQINFADLSNSLPPCKIKTLEGHDNRVSALIWHEQCKMLASAGYDGTVRVWTFDKHRQLCLDRTLIFQVSLDMYGNELQGKRIGLVRWSPSAQHLAAAMENIINIWSIGSNGESSDAYNCFIEDQHELVTSITWPKLKYDDNSLKEYLIVGKIDGTVSLISIYKKEKEIQHLVNCSMAHRKY